LETKYSWEILHNKTLHKIKGGRSLPAKVERKLMKHGTSAVVAIPMDYRRYFNLNPGSRVTVLYDSFILIVPKDMENILQEKRGLIDELLR